MSRGPALQRLHVFSGFLKSGPSGELKIPPQSLEPIRDLILLTSDPSCDAAAGQLIAWKSDHKGLLYPLSSSGECRSTPVHELSSSRRIFHVPPSILLQAWRAKRENWPKAVTDLYSRSDLASHGVDLSIMEIKKGDLRPPDRDSKDEAESAYREWYDSEQGGTTWRGFVLPKVRAVLLVFSRALPQTTVELIPQSGAKTLTAVVSVDSGHSYAVFTGDHESLPTDLYTIRVKGLRADQRWTRTFVETDTYELREMIRFNVTNFAGEFDIVTCDPISVEEAMMLQFPALYPYLAIAAKQRELYPDFELDVGFKDFPPALKAWSERVGWAHSKAKLAVKLINADGASDRARVLGKAVWNSIEPRNEYLVALKNSIDLGFGIHEARKDWRKLVALLAAEKEMEGLKELIWADLKSQFQRYRWWNYVTEQRVNGNARILHLQSLSASERKVVLKAGIPEKRTRLQELIGESSGKVLEKSLTAASTALDVYKAALAFNDVLETRKDLEDLESDFASLIEQVVSALDRGPSREGIGTLERMRTATVAADLELDEATDRALMAALDLVLGVLSMLGTGGLALGVLVLAKDVAGLVKDQTLSLAEWLDRVALSGALQDLYGRLWEQRAALVRSSHSNQGLIPSCGPDGGIKDLRVQFRLRAEALYGLVGLLTRAGVASESQAEYLERVRKYRVAEYIQNFILNDGWQLPVRPIVPISMDAAWLYLTGPFSDMPDAVAVREQLGFSRPLTAAAISNIPGSMTMLAVLDSVVAGNAVARFQDTFPIHRMEAEDVEALAMAFRTAWCELDEDSIEYTCIYTRPRESTDDAAWKPVNAGGSNHLKDLEILSPFDQIRILLVLKESVPAGTYPVSFQLVRTDWANLKGPIYREITRRLGSELLPSEEEYKGRLGCVFHPFFQFGGLGIVPGTKPLASVGVDLAGADLWHQLGFLGDMRYGFLVRMGDSSGGSWVKLGGPNGSSPLDEFRVGIRGRPDEKKLLIADFLRRESETFEYPLLFDMGKGVGPCYARVGGGKYLLATPDEDAILPFKEFNWKDSVEFILVVWANKLATDNYARAELDWTRIPLQMELFNIAFGPDDRGPSYSSTLNYVGTLLPGTRTLKPGEKEVESQIAEWVRQVRSNPAELEKLIRAVDPQNFGSARDPSERYHVFAAHFRLDYHTPDGEQVSSLRPFGDVLVRGGPADGDDYYRIAIRNVRAVKNCGLEAEQILAPISESFFRTAGYVRNEYEFHFRAPGSHRLGVPWATVPEDRVLKWINKEGSKRDPDKGLLKK